LSRLDLAALGLRVIENVGNLVCPAEFDVGAHAGAMVFSITEGEEKPLKYPVMFRPEPVPINTMDLLPRLDFDLEAFRTDLRALNPGRAALTCPDVHVKITAWQRPMESARPRRSRSMRQSRSLG
jgi:hydrogenase nickel incorporation protein HypB